MSAISQSGLLHSALGREKSQCRSIVNNFQCRQCSSHLLLTIQISRVVEKLKGRESSFWLGWTQLWRPPANRLSACAPWQGMEIQHRRPLRMLNCSRLADTHVFHYAPLTWKKLRFLWNYQNYHIKQNQVFYGPSLTISKCEKEKERRAQLVCLQ